jgi:hypothetical protein
MDTFYQPLTYQARRRTFDQGFGLRTKLSIRSRALLAVNAIHA